MHSAITYLANFVTTLLYFFRLALSHYAKRCCRLEGCSLSSSLISWTSPVAHYAVCNITYLAKYITTLVSLFSPCPSPLCRVLLQAWGRYIYCTLGQDWPNTKSTVSIEEWLCYFLMCHFHSLYFVTIIVFVFTFVFVALSSEHSPQTPAYASTQ